MGFLGKKESAHLSPLCCISGVPCSCRGSSLGCSGGGGALVSGAWVLKASPGTSAALSPCSPPRGEASAQCGPGTGGKGGAAALRGFRHPPAKHHLAEGGAQHPRR